MSPPLLGNYDTCGYDDDADDDGYDDNDDDDDDDDDDLLLRFELSSTVQRVDLGGWTAHPGVAILEPNHRPTPGGDLTFQTGFLPNSSQLSCKTDPASSSSSS